MSSVSQSADVSNDVAGPQIAVNPDDAVEPVELPNPMNPDEGSQPGHRSKQTRASAGDTDNDTPAGLDGETGDEDGVRADPDDQDTDDEAGTGEDTEMLEFDFGGNKLEVPKDGVTPELAEKIDEFTKGTWTKFTRGQQENVERSRQLDTRESTVATLATLNGEALQTYAYGLNVRSEIVQLSQVDTNALWQSSDPEDHDRARRVSDTLGAKQAELQQIIAIVGDQERAAHQARMDTDMSRAEEGVKYLDRHIKHFSTEKAPQLVDYVVETYGMPREQAERWSLNPMVTRMAYKAMLFDRQTQRANGKLPASQSPQRQQKPVTSKTTSGQATPNTRAPDAMSMGQLAKYLELPG